MLSRNAIPEIFPCNLTSFRMDCLIISLLYLAAILAALQTILNFEKRATRHRTAGARYNAIRREILQLLATIKEFREKPNDVLTPLRRQIDSFAEDSPQPPNRIWNRVIKDMPAKRFEEYYPSDDAAESNPEAEASNT